MPYTDSEPAEATLSLSGVWLHDPLDPEGSVRQFAYGRAARGASITPAAGATHYAGRRYPVVDYGDPQADVFSVTVHVPHGSTWSDDVIALQDFAEIRRTLCFRDNRGRRVFGWLAGAQEVDTDWGTRVSFTMTRVDFDEDVS